MNEITTRLLAECNKAKYTKVTITATLFTGMEVACEPADKRDRAGWPAIWGIMRRVGILWGCGGPGTHQVKLDSGLECGVYECDNGEWSRTGSGDDVAAARLKEEQQWRKDMGWEA